MGKEPLKPQEILEASLDVSVRKAKSGFVKLAVLGFLAGAFIAFAAEGSSAAAFNLLASPTSYGLGRTLAGALFGVGLMLVLLAGGELFTGNVLMVGGAIKRRIGCGAMLRNWLIVYAANFAGALFIAWLMYRSGLFHGGGEMLGAVTVKTAAGKTGLSFAGALILGVLCNWLVCLAVWLSYGADTMAGKILSVFFPIWLFIVSGFEHSVANMYYVPAGIFAKTETVFAEAAAALGVTREMMDGLNWQGFFAHNLLPVTIGNIIGGGLFVSAAYLLAFREDGRKAGGGVA
ncbi:MAG: formate/nitrite transporter family protein [Clostridiales Family XIII bacterium]|jgi:formate/nitrite transporter|nr:formate/nitrite transporter family protein [Clostridiales Family XIII bacterium]